MVLCHKNLKKQKLTIELIPKTCQFSNARTMLSKKDWDKVRHISYENADNKCEICGDVGKNQGYKHNVECHEIWEFDDETHTQTLIGLISLCVICHQVKHLGRAIKMGRLGICTKQLAQVNKWNKAQIAEHIATSFELYKERSKYEWYLDISVLNSPPYNLDIDVDKERIFVIRKYKKKRKKKKTVKKATAKKTSPKLGNKRPPRKKN